MKLIKDKRIRWILFGMLTIGIRAVLVSYPTVVEKGYSRGVFQLIRFVFDWTIACLPLPVLYLMVLFIPAFFIWKLIKNVRGANGGKRKVYELLISVLGFAAAVVALFLWLWGFNYLRIPIEDQIGIKPVPISTPELREELNAFTTKIAKERREIPAVVSSELTDFFLPENLESEIQLAVTKTMLSLGYPVSERLAVRKLFKGSLLRIGTAGFYLPFTGECNVDAGLHPLQLPYVMAHEMAHGLGIGDEGSCNFIAYLSCENSENPFIRYSGNLSFWRTLASNYRRQKPEIYKEYRAALPEGIIADLDGINKNGAKYPDLFPVLRDQTYDAFLKTQGIKEGMKNYNRVIVLERAWRKKTTNQ